MTATLSPEYRLRLAAMAESTGRVESLLENLHVSTVEAMAIAASVMASALTIEFDTLAERKETARKILARVEIMLDVLDRDEEDA